MTTSLSIQPNLLLSSFLKRTTAQTPMFTRTHFGKKPTLSGSICVAKFSLGPEPSSADGVKELLGVAERLLFTLADAAVSSSDAVTITKQNSDWLSGITNVMETVLKVLKDGLSAVHVPYAYGFAIILLTVLVKAATFPLTKKQVESAMAMRSLTPQVKAIQERYAGDKERIQLETARLYKLAGLNPLAGCLPILATIPVWIGLYRALSNVADEGLLTEGFFWVPSLAGPTTVASRQSGGGTSWLFPFVDGHPPLGWSDTLAYLVLPVLLVVSQYISVKIMQSSQSNDPNMKSSQALTNFLPLMIGYFALSVPSGLSLYWFTNNILSTAQQVWLQKSGGTKNPMKQFSDIIKEDQFEIQKSVSGLNSTKEVRQAEKVTTQGPPPGERFKQLKEQEAKRRQQKGKDRKAAEIAATCNRTINEQNRDKSVLESANEIGTDLLDNNNGNSPLTREDASIIGDTVNGNTSSQVLKEDDHTISVFRTDDSKVSANYEGSGRDGQQAEDSLEKEGVEVHRSSAIADSKLAEEETHEASRQR